MSLTTEDIKKITHLARLSFSETEIALYGSQLDRILDFIAQMNAIDTTTIEPLAHPLDLSQRLRQDVISEKDERDQFQKIAPQVESGLYLVPKVIEEA